MIAEIDWQSASQLFLSFALVAATLVLVYATWKLVSEARLSRADLKRPKISVKLKAYKDHGDFIQLVLCNVGQGAAFNVDFHLEGDEGILGNHGVLWRGTVAPINFMASGETETYEMGSRDTLFADPVMPPFPVDITYRDVDGIVYQEKIMLDVAQFELLQWLGASVAWRQMKALEDIAKLLQER